MMDLSAVVPQRIIPVLGRLAIGMLVATVFFSPFADAGQIEDPGAPVLLLKTPVGEALPAMLEHTHASISIQGSSVRVTLTQVFTNPFKTWMNGVYLLPLPPKAAVHGWSMDIGDRRLVGVIRERKEAVKRFEAAKSEGRRAGMLEAVTPGLFHINLANIDPGSRVTAEVNLTFAADIRGRQLSIALPTTLVPRYQSALGSDPDGGPAPVRLARQASWGLGNDVLSAMFEPGIQGNPSSAVPLRTRVRHPFSYDVELNPGTALTNVTTPFHDSEVSRDNDFYRLHSSKQPAELNRDFVLRWELAPSVDPLPTVAVEEVNGEWFGSLEIVEPSEPLALVVPPREMLFVIDVSGSMGGAPIRQAKAAATFALGLLKPADRFNLIAFDHRVFTAFGEPQLASEGNVAAAEDFIGDLEADGGTEIGPALDAVFSQLESSGHERPQVLFMTDGAVGGEGALFQKIHSQLGRSRLSTVAIGAAPNEAFMRQTAVIGRGLYRRIDNLEAVAVELNELLLALSRPLLTDVSIDWPMNTVPAKPVIADLYQGEPVRSLVKFDSAPAGGVVTVRGELAGWPWQQDVVIRTDGPNGGSGGVASRWAQSRVDWLLDTALLSDAGTDQVRDEVLAIALQHDLVTPFTALLAEEMRVAKPPSVRAGQFVIPNQSPTETFRFSQTATIAPQLLYFGLLLLFLGVMVIALSRDEAPRDHSSGEASSHD